MFGPTGMALGPFVLPSSVAPELDGTYHDSESKPANAAQDSGDFLRPRVEALEQFSPTLLEVPADPPHVDKAMKQADLHILPPSNASYQMAYFLQTTGPPSEAEAKDEKPQRVHSKPKTSSFRYLKSRAKQASQLSTDGGHEYAPTAFIAMFKN